jgi:outer membrane protein assembly factor BamD (BamD/ComL family)
MQSTKATVFRGLFFSEDYMWGRLTIIGMLALSIIAGCAGDKGKELYETAQFEEKQGNREHALKLYQEIVQKHAGSELAKKAEGRLAELGKAR